MRNGDYNLVIAPEGYPGAIYRGRYAQEHWVNYWLHHGTIPPKGWVIHHKDENKTNNHPLNLEPMTDADHKRLHAKPRRTRLFVCKGCGKKCVQIKNIYLIQKYCSKGCRKRKNP